MSASIASYLPQTAGWLAHWQLFVAVTAIFNSVQNFATLKLTRRIYNNVPPANVTPLQARTFAVWTLTSAVVRAYAAYHIHDKTTYDMAMFTYLIAFGHFSSEWLIFRSAKFGAGLLGPIIVSTTSMIWMFKQYDYYVKV
ncbi:Erg28 like protein-domain-containing protein [Collybia nuda]|uniref:Erg28 like protein-domain-containing protein n=1 Tax=Collybia nuda TaxID=64659 RepID=A0A9P5YFV2_9AGAR|nr:Erg28 like protein-domain-containing protein [Collybia nuda]